MAKVMSSTVLSRSGVSEEKLGIVMSGKRKGNLPGIETQGAGGPRRVSGSGSTSLNKSVSLAAWP